VRAAEAQRGKKATHADVTMCSIIFCCAAYSLIIPPSITRANTAPKHLLELFTSLDFSSRAQHPTNHEQSTPQTFNKYKLAPRRANFYFHSLEQGKRDLSKTFYIKKMPKNIKKNKIYSYFTCRSFILKNPRVYDSLYSLFNKLYILVPLFKKSA